MINIVYHCYLVGDWQSLVIEQINRLKKSKLYDAADNIYVTVNTNKVQEEEFNTITKDYSKLQKSFFYNNEAEYPGIKKVREIGLEKKSKILYFHTKGISNNYVRYNQKIKSNDKIKNICSWRECLEYFLIDKWEECIKKLDDFDNVGVTCNNGWFWGNFWWTQFSHLKKTKEVKHGDRWSYEAWLNNEVSSKNYEWYNFTYNPYITYSDPDWYKGNKYKGQKIILKKAFYGSIEYEIDEGYSGSKLGVGKDVTEIVKKLLEQKNNNCFDFTVTNETMCGDPVCLTKKFLIVEFSPESNTGLVFKMGFDEGRKIRFSF